MFRTTLFALSTLLLASTVTAAPKAAPAPAEVSFANFAPLPNSQQRQTLRMTVTMAMKPVFRADASEQEQAQAQAKLAAAKFPITMTTEALNTIKTGKPDAEGWLPMQMRTQMGQMLMKNSAGETLPLPPNPATNIAFSARFNPRDYAFDGLSVEGQAANPIATKAAEAALKNAFSTYKSLLGQTVKLGETVTVPIDMPMELPIAVPGGGKVQATARYTLTKLERGVAHFDIGMDLKLDASFSAPPSAAASAPTGQMGMSGTGSGQGQMVLRLADRLTQRMTLDMKQQFLMSPPSGDAVEMQMDMRMGMTGESVAPGKR